MSDDDTQFRYVSPPEYVKHANARDRRVKHNIDLHHFMDFIRESKDADRCPFLGSDEVDTLISAYLDEVEPEPSS